MGSRRYRAVEIPEAQAAVVGANVRVLRQRNGWTQARLGELMGWRLFVAAYIAVDVSDRWPTDADLRKIAKRAAQSATQLDITEATTQDAGS